VNSTPAEKLLEVTPEATALGVAKLIADKLIFYSRTEWYRFRINHDIGPPKHLACPVPYDWTTKGYVGIDSTNKAHVRKWLTDAAIAGYEIEEVDIKHKPTERRTESIEYVRKRAAFHQRPKVDHDDDIPF
jgi:hypothetical protein